MSNIQTCSVCGSEEVARCKWVNVNTDHIYSADSGTSLEWCFDCNEQTSIIEKPCSESSKHEAL
jgi:hypothetical protein